MLQTSVPSLFAGHPHREGTPTGGHPHWEGIPTGREPPGEGSAVLACVLGLAGRLIKRALSVCTLAHATPIPSGDGKHVFCFI